MMKKPVRVNLMMAAGPVEGDGRAGYVRQLMGFSLGRQPGDGADGTLQALHRLQEGIRRLEADPTFRVTP